MTQMTTDEALIDLFETQWDDIRISLSGKVLGNLYTIRSRYLNGGILSTDKKEETLKLAGYEVTSEKRWKTKKEKQAV